MGVANRGDYDLQNHGQQTGLKLDALDPTTNTRVVPYVIEPSFGLDRLALALLVDCFAIEETPTTRRVILKLKNNLAPYQVAVLPLTKKAHGQVAKTVFNKITRNDGLRVTYDESGSIGRRYRRQDAIGTPLCLTITDDTDHHNHATIRFRDTMEQIEIDLDDLKKYL